MTCECGVFLGAILATPRLVFFPGLLVAPCCLTSAFLLGQVIKAWDIGVATMKKGEICYLLCKPEYAYGSAGSAPKIPSNATLFFEASNAGELVCG